MPWYKITFIFLIFSVSLLKAEKWTAYESTIGNVDAEGYFNIELPQELVGLSSKKDFSDIRIFDSNNQEVPYFVHSDEMIREINQYERFPLVANTAKDSLNQLIIHNTKDETLDRFYVTSKPADVIKRAQIRGSNDMKNWFIVKQVHEVSTTRQQYGNDVLVIDFPKSKYKYFELNITNNQEAPLLIVDVSQLKSSSAYAQLSYISPGQLIQKDSTDNNTYIYFPELKYPYRLDKIEFHVSFRSDYLRNGTILPGARQNFTLSSNGNNAAILESYLFKPDYSLKIINQNNPPLQIDSVSFYGLNRYLCAFLTDGENYKIVMDEKEYSSRPAYDIEHFRNKIPLHIPTLQCAAPTFIYKEKIAAPERDKLWIEKPVFLWSIIILVGLFLGFMCWRVIKEMKAREK